MPNLVSHLVYTVAPGFAPPLVPFAPPLTRGTSSRTSPCTIRTSAHWSHPSHLVYLSHLPSHLGYPSHLVWHLVYTVAPGSAPPLVPFAPGSTPPLVPFAPPVAPPLIRRTSRRTGLAPGLSVAPGLAPGLYRRPWFRTSPCTIRTSPHPSHLLSHLVSSIAPGSSVAPPVAPGHPPGLYRRTWLRTSP
ncbi:hypothetical protein FPV67DRAFT_1669959 [Lyophyllum atratum]|nr:hypothetical protein FPV67DRAFT_1669959 [Lyophyllum atratum]